jgi:hypothetical protein
MINFRLDGDNKEITIARHIEFCTKVYHTHIHEFGVKYCFHLGTKTWRSCEILRLYLRNLTCLIATYTNRNYVRI